MKKTGMSFVSAAIGMFGIAPIGTAVLPFIQSWREWVFETTVTGAYRRITVGAYLGAFAIASRILLGLERSHLTTGGR